MALYFGAGGATSTETRCHALFTTPRRFQIGATLSGCVLYAESTAREINSSWQRLDDAAAVDAQARARISFVIGTLACHCVHAHARAASGPCVEV